ncbi:MAG: methyltransferase domain-containing protein [Chloroflexota bacterium]|nr:methyltransferase domain-containing protein [Chloroflexota bacterium]MDE2907907.1 methyltransferase domain-containing protein [Chloroflexota bacterium]
MASLRFRLRQQYWRWTAPGKISAYLRETQSPRLQIGAGYNMLSGWLNTTLYPFAPGAVYLDASQPFPLPSAAFDYVFSEHVIEHIEFEEAALMLSESARVLKSGGRIRLATPDLAQIIALYVQPGAPAQQAYIRWIMDNFRPQIGEYNPAQVINHSFHGWRHKFIYDEPTLIKALTVAGFSAVTRVEPGQSGDENLRGIEQHGDYVGSDAAMRYETMVFEAVKP